MGCNHRAGLITQSCVMLLFVAGGMPSVACASGAGGSGDGDGDGESGEETTGDILIQLPPEVESRLVQLTDDLQEIICERSDNCCGMYGLHSLKDCREIAGASISWQAPGIILEGGPDEFDFSVDEVFAAACLDTARAFTTDCTFEEESLFWAWHAPCSRALRAQKKGEVPVECSQDQECEIKHGAGYLCIGNSCKPERVVPLGESCEAVSGETQLPSCGPDGWCVRRSTTELDSTTYTCEERGQPGTDCFRSDLHDSCVDGHTCLGMYLPDGTYGNQCVPLRLEGESCGTHYDCLEGTCDTNADVCVHVLAIGDPCSTDDDCFPMLCLENKCSPRELSICAPREP